MTKFFIDENLPAILAKSLSTIFRQHSFTHADQEHLRGVEDVDLIADISMREFEAIITADSRQLINPDERAALRDHNVHWIGFSREDSQGIRQIASIASTVTGGLAHVLESWETTPTAYWISSTTAISSTEKL